MKYKKWLLASVLFFLIIACGESEKNTNKEDETGNTKNENFIDAVPVEALLVKEKKIEQKFPLTGVLSPKNSVDIIAEVSGKATSIKKELGDYVRANQVLVIINDVIPASQLKQAEAQILSTESNLKIAESNFKSDKLLFKSGDISELEFNNSQLAYKNAKAQYLSALAALSTAKKTFSDTRIKSPISGFVSRKNINYGSMVSSGIVVYRVVDLSKLKIKVSVPQEIINRIKIGNNAIITISALNNKQFNGVVKRISPQADESTGGFMIEIQVNNRESLIKAGMTAKIELILSTEQKAFAVPEYALVSKNEENYIYKIVNDYAELVKIDVGESIGKNIIVKNGLNISDKIVVVGMKNLGLKTKVNIEKLH